MLFVSKIFSFITQPLAWVALLMLISMLFVRTRPLWAIRLEFASLALLLLLGWEPLPDALLRHLESQSPPLTSAENFEHYVGVVVLGGALEPAYVWTVPGQSALNDAAERMTAVLPLLRKHPHLRVLFTGGEGELFANGPSEAQRARMFFESQGIAPNQVLYESASTTTYENAIFSKRVEGVNAGEPWLLLTSAWHMPRSIAAFRGAGWNVTACPVDFRSGITTPWLQYSMDQGVRKWRIALHELLGLLVYRLAGRA
jgi:uncharacterized SAM-binding protein YcdF (DUF218 family)